MGRTRHVRFGRRTQRHQADEREQHHVGEHVVHRRRRPLDSDELLRAALVAHGDQLPDQQRELDVRLIRPIERICLLRSHSHIHIQVHTPHQYKCKCSNDPHVHTRAQLNV